MSENARNLPPFTDAELDADLLAIDAEVKRRKKAGELSALWAYEARIAAIHRLHARYPVEGEKEYKWPDLTRLEP